MKGTHTITTLDETKAVASDFVVGLTPASAATVVALHGDLGAGKTTFVQALALVLGVSEVVTSPTFVIMKQYETDDSVVQLLVHIDAYRLESPEEIETLGFTEICSLPNTLVCVEWAEKIAPLLPADTQHLTFALEGSERTITFS